MTGGCRRRNQAASRRKKLRNRAFIVGRRLSKPQALKLQRPVDWIRWLFMVSPAARGGINYGTTDSVEIANRCTLMINKIRINDL